MIVKIQRPLMTTEGTPPALIYNRSRNIYTQVPFTSVEVLFEPDELKIYVKAHLDKDGQLSLGRKLRPNFDW